VDATDIGQLRGQYAERIRREAGVRSAGLVRGLATVPREHFVGPGPWMLLKPAQMSRGYQRTTDANPRHLYDTVLVALDAKRGLNNGEPTALLRFLDSLELRPGERFLHIGCGVGYYTAIAAHALSPGGTAVGVEIDPELAARALENLAPYDNADALLADGSLLSGGPFDAIFVNAGATEVRSEWLNQLSDGGRLLVPLTVALSAPAPLPGVSPTAVSGLYRDIGAGYMLLVTRHSNDYTAQFIAPVAIFHCEGARLADTEKLLRQAYQGGDQASVQILRRDAHKPQRECWLHTASFCLSRVP
jgi:protein-L-isoaspartate(D-aspartate) O-methyltransferase